MTRVRHLLGALRRLAAVWLATATVTVPLVCGAALPSDSVLQLPIRLTAQDGKAFPLASRAGGPQIVGFMFTHCPYICPLIVDTARLTEKKLTPAERARLRILLVSLDSERDTPEVLARFAAQRKLDLRRWTLARTDDASLRTLTTMLGVKYRRLDSGDFNHSTMLLLLDESGRVIARTETMGSIDGQFLQALRKTLAGP